MRIISLIALVFSLACVKPESDETDINCESLNCDPETDFCARSVSDIGGIDDEYACELLPAACIDAGTLDCECLLTEDPLDCGAISCDHSDGAMELTCPGG